MEDVDAAFHAVMHHHAHGATAVGGGAACAALASAAATMRTAKRIACVAGDAAFAKCVWVASKKA